MLGNTMANIMASEKAQIESILAAEPIMIKIKNNNLSVLTSSIFSLKEIEKNKLQDLLKKAEEEANKDEINDQTKYLVDQKIEVLRSLN